MMWNRVFPAISVNKDGTVNSDCSPNRCELLSPKGILEEGEYLLSNSQNCSHSLWWGPRKGSSGCENRRLALDRWAAYERNGFSKPRLLHLAIHRKSLNSLTSDICFFLINNLLMFRLPSPCCKLLYNLTPPPAPQNRSLRVTWNAISWVWSPKNSHQIKHNSPLLGCEYFFLNSTTSWKHWISPYSAALFFFFFLHSFLDVDLCGLRWLHPLGIENCLLLKQRKYPTDWFFAVSDSESFPGS